jgi:hypothetical protein
MPSRPTVAFRWTWPRPKRRSAGIDISIKDSDDQRALVFWFARRAELLRTGLEAAERIAVIAAALLYVLLSDAEYVGGRSGAIRAREAARR